MWAMDADTVNKLWQRDLKKSVARTSHHPKAPKGHRWEVTTKDSSYVPKDGRRRERMMP